MALPLPASDKVDTRTVVKPATQVIRADEWNQLVQAVAEIQAAQTGVIPRYDIAVLPAASAGLLGHLVQVTQAGQPSTLQVCLGNSSGGYEWVTLQQSS